MKTILLLSNPYEQGWCWADSEWKGVAENSLRQGHQSHWTCQDGDDAAADQELVG